MLIAGNWKMNLNSTDLFEFQKLIVNEKIEKKVEIAIFPQFPQLQLAKQILSKYNVKIGAQSCSSQLSGAFTGDVSADAISDIGCDYCIVGHSERREFHNETNEFVKNSASLLLSQNITPIICVGESLNIKLQNRTQKFIHNQIKECIPDIVSSSLIIAYEPLWAIGTGRIPKNEEIMSVHNVIFNELSHVKNLKIIYGGSVNSSNCSNVLKLKNVHGALIGGSSLKFKDFLAIYKTAVKQVI